MHGKHIATLVLGVLGALGAGSAAQTQTKTPLETDAAQLFRRVDYYLTEYYRGPTTASVNTLLEQTRSKLERLCGSKPRCAFSTAGKVIQPMITALGDEHTYLLPPDQSRFWDRFEAYRMGVTLKPYRTAGARVVVTVGRDTPAARAGLKRGDVIVRINGVRPSAFAPPTSRSSRLKLEVMRAGRTFPTTLRTASWQPEHDLPTLEVVRGIGILRIPTFFEDGGDGTEIGREVHRLTAQLVRRKIGALVVDVRDNGGGQLTNCMTAANAFVPELGYKLRHNLADVSFSYKRGVLSLGGNTLSSRTSFFQQELERIEPYTRYQGKVAVLVNKDTASCGEIFAYLLARVGRASVIGEKTFGVSNSATRFFELPGDYAMGVTIGQLHNFDGSRLPAFVTPHIPAKDDLELLATRGWDGPLERARQVLSRK